MEACRIEICHTQRLVCSTGKALVCHGRGDREALRNFVKPWQVFHLPIFFFFLCVCVFLGGGGGGGGGGDCVMLHVVN